MMGDLASLCVCGHMETLHQHYRPGTECGVCGCRRFRHQYNVFQRFMMWLGF